MSGSAWTNQVENQVIIAGPNGSLLVYNPTVGTGNLVDSISAILTNDGHGNIVAQGIWSYGSTAWIGIENGILAINIPGVGEISAVNADSAGDIAFQGLRSAVFEAFGLPLSGATAASFTLNPSNLTLAGIPVLQMDSNTIICSTHPGGTAMETFQGITPINGWAQTAGFVAAQYQLVPLGGRWVQFAGELDGTAATSATFYVLPAAYRPASKQRYGITATGGAAAGASVGMEVDTAGNCTIVSTTGFPLAQSFGIGGAINLAM